MIRHNLLTFLPLLLLLAFGSARAGDASPSSGAAMVADDAGAAERPDAPVDGVDVVPDAGATPEDGVEITGEFRRELRTVEEEVNHLKERVFRSKATLQLLKELVIEGATVGSRVIIWHVNKMSGAYTMESVQYFLDGKNIYTKVDPGGQLDSMRELKIHEQNVPPGTHNLQVNYVLRGRGFGLFSYLRTYQFKVQSTYAFKIEEGRATVVRVTANEKGGIRKSFVDKPTVEYDQRTEALRDEQGP